MRAVSEAVVMLTPKVKAVLFIATPTRPTPAMARRSFRPTLRPWRSKSTAGRSTSPARRNRIATKGSGGTSETANLTATGLVPRKRTARSKETSVSIAALPLPSFMTSDCTTTPGRRHLYRTRPRAVAHLARLSIWFNKGMRFGISTFATDEGIAPGALARAIEERGFDSLFLAEHTHIPLSRKSPWPRGGELPRKYYRTLDPFITLTAAAATTERLLLGTGVALVVERDPIITAKEVASLDLVSGGRMIFGIGVGWNREEMENHGTDPRTRGKLTNERIRAMIEIWTKDEAEFHGQYVDFDPIGAWPKPVQKP